MKILLDFLATFNFTNNLTVVKNCIKSLQQHKTTVKSYIWMSVKRKYTNHSLITTYMNVSVSILFWCACIWRYSIMILFVCSTTYFPIIDLYINYFLLIFDQDIITNIVIATWWLIKKHCQQLSSLKSVNLDNKLKAHFS